MWTQTGLTRWVNLFPVRFGHKVHFVHTFDRDWKFQLPDLA